MNQPAVQEYTTEELYRTILNAAPDWLEWKGSNHHDHFVSSAVFQITGYPPEDFINKPGLVIEISHPDDRETIAQHRHDMLNHKTGDCEFDYRIVHRSGEVRWIHHQCHSILRDGKWIGCQVTNRDITVRKKQEEELQSSYNTIKALMNTPMDGMMLIAPDGTIHAVNPVMAQGFGLPAEQIIGSNTFDLFPPRMAEFRRELIRKVIETGLPTRFESQGIVGDVDVTIYPIPDQNGKIFQLAITARDISERKRAEEELLKSYQTVKALLGAPSDIACVLDLDGTIRLINETYAKMYQSTPDDLIGTRIWDLYPAERAEFRQVVFKQVQISKKTARVEDYSPHGYFDSVIQPIFNQQGEVVQIAVLARDITDRVNAENLLREREALLRTVVENASVILAVLDLQGNITFIQGDIRKTNNESVKAVLGQNIHELDYIPPELKSGFNQTILGEDFTSDRLRLGDQTFTIQLKPIHHQNGEVVGVIGIGLDISEVLQIENELRQSKKELEVVLDHHKDAIGVFNREHELIYVNPAGIRMADFSSVSELIETYQQTKRIGVLDESQAPVDFSTILNRLFQQRNTSEREILLRTPDHPEERVVNIQFIPVPDEQGDPRLIIMVARDITESKKVEEQIRANQAELEQKIADRTIELNQANRELRERIQESERAAIHAEALARVAAHTSVLSELPAFLQMVCDEIIQTVHYDFSSIISYDEKTDAFFMAALSPLIELPRQYPVYSRMVVENFIREFGSTIVIPDIRALPADYKGLDLLLLFGVRTLIIIPMIANGEIFGTLNVASVNEVRVPAASEINLLKALTDQATIGFTKARLFEQISESRVRLQTLSEKLVEIQEQEKRNLASELHDEIGQSLTSLHLNLEIIARTKPEAWNTQQDMREQLERANQTTVHLLERVREISLDLRPAMLDDLGLIPALLAFFERYSAQTQIQVHLKHNGVERRFTPKVETAVFRIIQEALTNVSRHTQSTQIAVRLWADSKFLRLQVEDDGAGFNPQLAMQQSLTSGLSGMTERAVSCGGSLEIESEPGQGTCLSAEFPL